MESRSEVESARLSMMEARRILEEYESQRDAMDPKVHSILIRTFQDASTKYLRLSVPKS